MPHQQPKFIRIQGEHIRTLEDFYSEFGRAVNGPGGYFGNNLDAFRDCLRGGFGIEPPFLIAWENSDRSRLALGYPETVRQLRKRLDSCHPDSQELVRVQLNEALSERGPTVFDWLVEIMRSADGISLDLRQSYPSTFPTSPA